MVLKCSLLFKIEITKFNNAGTMGVTLAELVKASVGQADLKRSEVRASSRALLLELRYVSCKVQAAGHFGQIGNFSERMARSLYKCKVFTKSSEEMRTFTVPSLNGL